MERVTTGTLVTRDDVLSAMTFVTAMIMDILRKQAKRQQLAIRVLDPRCTGTLVVLHSENIGTDGHLFGKIAMGKAAMCMREGMDSGRIVREKLCEDGDPECAGGVIIDGLIVACSGVEDFYDEQIARLIASAALAEAQRREVDAMTGTTS